jgi:hypothetical protein
MQNLLRRVRGAIGMGLTWALAWGGAGVVMAVVTGFTADAPFPLVFGVLGFLAGVIFSVVLALTAGRRHFAQMSLPRFATWGAVGGILMSVFFTRAASLEGADVPMVATIFALASAACASGSLALARRAARGELPGAGRQSTGFALDDHETRKLR